MLSLMYAVAAARSINHATKSIFLDLFSTAAQKVLCWILVRPPALPRLATTINEEQGEVESLIVVQVQRLCGYCGAGW